MDSLKTSLNQKPNDEEFININYWKEIHNEISNILREIRGLVLITHNSIEINEIIKLLNKTRTNNFNNILYISLIRSYEFLKTALEINPLDNKKVTIIDCVSGYAFPPEDSIDNCLYHQPPNNLDQMKEIISFGIEKCNPDIIVLDSLTQFINFTKPTEHDINELYKFLQSLKTSSLNIIQDTFLLLYDTKLGIMQNLPKKTADHILKIEKIKQEKKFIY